VILMLDRSWSMWAKRIANCSNTVDEPDKCNDYNTAHPDFASQLAAGEKRTRELLESMKERSDVTVSLVTFGNEGDYKYDGRGVSPAKALSMLEAYFAAPENPEKRDKDGNKGAGRFNHVQTYLWHSIFEVVKEHLNKDDKASFTTDSIIPQGNPNLSVWVFSDGQDDPLLKHKKGGFSASYENWVKNNEDSLQLDWRQWWIYATKEQQKTRDLEFADFDGYDVLFNQTPETLAELDAEKLADVVVTKLPDYPVYLVPAQRKKQSVLDRGRVKVCEPQQPIEEPTSSLRNAAVEARVAEAEWSPRQGTSCSDELYPIKWDSSSLCKALLSAYPSSTFYLPKPIPVTYNFGVGCSYTNVVTLSLDGGGEIPQAAFDKVHINTFHAMRNEPRQLKLSAQVKPSPKDSGKPVSVSVGWQLRIDEREEKKMASWKKKRFAGLVHGDDVTTSLATTHKSIEQGPQSQTVVLRTPKHPTSNFARFLSVFAIPGMPFIPPKGERALEVCMTPTVSWGESTKEPTIIKWKDYPLPKGKTEASGPGWKRSGDDLCIQPDLKITRAVSWFVWLVLAIVTTILSYLLWNWFWRPQFPVGLMLGNPVNSGREPWRKTFRTFHRSAPGGISASYTHQPIYAYLKTNGKVELQLEPPSNSRKGICLGLRPQGRNGETVRIWVESLKSPEKRGGEEFEFQVRLDDKRSLRRDPGGRKHARAVSGAALLQHRKHKIEVWKKSTSTNERTLVGSPYYFKKVKT